MWLLLPLGAAAQSVTGAARVTTVVDSCVPIDIELFHRLLAIELGTSIQYSPGAAQAPDGATVYISCSAPGIELQLADSVTRKSMQRSLELPQVAVAARTRLLALTVAEFVVASWVELRLAQPPLQPVGPRASEEVARRATQVASERLPPAPVPEPAEDVRWLLGVGAEPMLFTSGGGALPQLSAHAELRPRQAIAVGLAFSLAHGEWEVRWPSSPIGMAQLTSTSGRATLAYVQHAGPLELLLGGGGRLGIVHLAGKTNRFGVVALEMYAPWGGPVLQLSAAVRLPHLRVGLELEAGYVTLPVETEIKGSVVAQLRGVFGSAGMRLGWLF